jgi:malonyl-CoA/methylmalonyl-CoA synthetase
VDEDGYFEISGPKMEVIITGGYNVYPREVEEVLEVCTGVAEVAVVELPDPAFGENVAAVVRDDPTLSAERVADFCREGLEGYKKPRQVAFVNALSRNALGKVLNHEVRDKAIEGER